MGCCVSSASGPVTEDSFENAGELQRNASARQRRIAFENRQLCRIQSFRGSTEHSAQEKEQLILIEKRRIPPSTLSPYPERDLRFYLEVTCHVPTADDDDPILFAPTSREQRHSLASSSSGGGGLSSKQLLQSPKSSRTTPKSTSQNHLRVSSFLLSQSLNGSSSFSSFTGSSSHNSGSALQLTSPHRKRVEFSNDFLAAVSSTADVPVLRE